MVLFRMIALALIAVILVPSGAHLFELPAKMTLDRDDYFAVQGIYRGWAWFAVPIIAAILANGALFWLERRRRGTTVTEDDPNGVIREHGFVGSRAIVWVGSGS